MREEETRFCRDGHLFSDKHSVSRDMSSASESTGNDLQPFQRRRSRPILLLWPVLPMACLHYSCGSLTWLSLWTTDMDRHWKVLLIMWAHGLMAESVAAV